MEQPQNLKNISIVIIIVLILIAGYTLFGKYPASKQVDLSNEAAIVMVKNTPMVDGVLPVPAEFPQDIPLEPNEILESATTDYPAQDARQLSVSYRSSKTIAQKYSEYKDYMAASGYQLEESDTGEQGKTIFGTKEGANLSVVISSSEGKTLVQLSYLLK